MQSEVASTIHSPRDSMANSMNCSMASWLPAGDGQLIDEKGEEEGNDNAEIYESERLKDPLNDRVVKSVPRPPTVALSVDRVFPLKPGGGDMRYEKPNVSLIRDYLL